MRLTGVPALFAVSSAQPTLASSSSSGPLHFPEKGTFQVSIFEDLHFGESAWKHGDLGEAENQPP
ncbi:hypothetical protein BDV09DRAFT_201049 [Aspergillus tetrazonus]